MSEAIVIGVVQELMSLLVAHNMRMTLVMLTNELTMILHWLARMNRSRTRNHWLADFAEMAQDIADLVRKIDQQSHYDDEIREALDWLEKAKKRILEFGVDEEVSRTQSVGEEGEEVVVVGLEKDVQQLIGRVILNEKSGLMTSCIKGMIGAGKTTLARQIYNHAAIVEKFKHRAWVSTSRNVSKHEVLVELMRQLVEVDGEEMDNRSLMDMLCYHLQRKACFIVIDNVLPEMRLESFLLGKGIFVFISYLKN